MPTFKASDGTEFTTRKEWRKYEFELSFTFRHRSGTKDEPLQLRKEPGSIGGQPFEIEQLDFCEVVIPDHTVAVQVDYVTNSR